MSSTPASSATNFFVLGLQRSGTTYVQRIVAKNTNLKHKKIGWKHGMDDLPDTAFKIGVTKSPYNWAKSICRRNRVDLFAKYKQYNLSEESGDCYLGVNLGNLMQLWNDWHAFWLEREILFLRYEELLESPFWPMKQISLKSGCEIDLPPVMANIKGPGLTLSDEQRAEYLTFPSLTDPLVRRINKYIDTNLLERLGHKHAK